MRVRCGKEKPFCGETLPDFQKVGVYTPCLFGIGSFGILMAQFIEFLVNHWILSGIWLGLVVTLVMYLTAKAGDALSPHQATLLVNRENAVFLDIRDKKAFDGGHIVDAINIPSAKLKDRMVELEKYRDKPLVVVCQMGHQSGEAVKTLTENGFSAVNRMKGGMTEWQSQGLPAVK